MFTISFSSFLGKLRTNLNDQLPLGSLVAFLNVMIFSFFIFLSFHGSDIPNLSIHYFHFSTLFIYSSFTKLHNPRGPAEQEELLCLSVILTVRNSLEKRTKRIGYAIDNICRGAQSSLKSLNSLNLQ